ncbi:MAG: ABC transporter permease subunit [Methanocella sp.]
MNFTRIARNEFVNLISNRYVYVAIFFFAINAVIYVIGTYDYYIGSTGSAQLLSRALADLLDLLIVYGGVVALMIGFSSMTDELMGHALNTLIAKPLYRDAIINGKLAGCLCFLTGMFILTCAIYMLLMIAFCGDAVIPSLPVMLVRLPLVIFMALLCSVTIFSIAVLLRVLIRDNTAALLAAVLVYLLMFYLMPNIVFVGQVSTLLGINGQDGRNLIMGLTPMWSEFQASVAGLFSLDVNMTQVIGGMWTELLKLVVMATIATVLSYIAFLRRDVA